MSAASARAADSPARGSRRLQALQFSERAQNGANHRWSVTVVLVRGVLTTSDVSWGEGGWRIRLKVG